MVAVWTPQPGPQTDAITADWCPILLYGGAKFGGKTDFLLGDFLQDVPKYKQHWQGILFRRSLVEFTDIKLRAQELYPKAGATWHELSHEWRFPGGAILRFKYLERLEDISKYEGQSFPWLGIDELGDWEDQTAFFRCLSLNRYGRAKIPTLRLRASCNPGGRGHAWLKRYFIDPAPAGYKPIFDDVLKCNRMFIPAKLEDNKIGLINDPGYEHRLMRSGSAALVKALRYGDWNVVAGAFFHTFCNSNVIKPFEIPSYWTKFMAHDPGWSDPFAFSWYAVSDGESQYPRGSIIKYREWLGEKEGFDGERTRGIKLEFYKLLEGLKNREQGDKIAYRVAGHDLWDTRKGPSYAELFANNGIYFSKAETKRKLGWRLMADLITGENGIPKFYYFDTCPKSIEYIPLLQHDIRDPEDVADAPFDHLPDTDRYAAMSRSYPTNQPSTELSLQEKFKPPSVNELWEIRDRERKNFL